MDSEDVWLWLKPNRSNQDPTDRCGSESQCANIVLFSFILDAIQYCMSYLTHSSGYLPLALIWPECCFYHLGSSVDFC